jgi:hypothetical protein
VVISVNSKAPMTSGSQPPCMIFSRFAPRKATSIDRNSTVIVAATGSGHRHRSVMITCSRMAVITIVRVTAIP